MWKVGEPGAWFKDGRCGYVMEMGKTPSTCNVQSCAGEQRGTLPVLCVQPRDHSQAQPHTAAAALPCPLPICEGGGAWRVLRLCVCGQQERRPSGSRQEEDLEKKQQQKKVRDC